MSSTQDKGSYIEFYDLKKIIKENRGEGRKVIFEPPLLKIELHFIQRH